MKRSFGLLFNKGGRIGRRHVLVATAMTTAMMTLPLQRATAAPPRLVVRQFQPHILGANGNPAASTWGGRSVAVDTSPAHPGQAIVASESGGLFKTTDNGVHWSHVDGLAPFRMNDVAYSPTNADVVIATTWADTTRPYPGSIWRSTDGGLTWASPPTALPTCNPQPAAWGVSFAPGATDVYVPTDCGVAVSHDNGATWAHVSVDVSGATFGRQWSVVAHGSGIVDICGDSRFTPSSPPGHRRSTDRGASFSAVHDIGGAGGCTWGFQNYGIDASPLEPDVLLVALDPTSVYESDDGGVSWSRLALPGGRSRSPWVRAHPAADGNPGHFDVYAGSGRDTFRQTCGRGGPGLRCSTAWAPVSVDHADTSGLAFERGPGNCPEYLVSDGGVHVTSDCGATWRVTGGGHGGFDALQLYQVTGDVHPDHTDLYIGTQDNNLWASHDSGASWPDWLCCEGFHLQVRHASPSAAGETVTGAHCGPCARFRSGPQFANASGWLDPPNGATSDPVLVSPGVYLQFGPPNNTLYRSTDDDASWQPVPGAVLNTGLRDMPIVAGPPESPTLYAVVNRLGGKAGLAKITGVLSSIATVSAADNGLGDVSFYCGGIGTFLCPSVVGADPADPRHVLAADRQTSELKVSRDGGATWRVDRALTRLVTGDGHYAFRGNDFGDQVHVIAFDPQDHKRILVGTEGAGVAISRNGGRRWTLVPGSKAVTAVTSFFFDEGRADVVVSTYGRGLWKFATG